MSCEHAFDRLDPANADTLGADAAEHLAACPRCCRAHRILERSRPVLRSLPVLPVSPDFTARLESRIARVQRERRARSRNLRLALGFGSGSALAAVLVLLLGTELPLPRAVSTQEAGTAAPSVRVVRPFASLAPASGPFASGTYADEIGPPLHLDRALPWGATFAGGEDVSWTGFERGSPATASWASHRPVVFAAPSWSFAAAPAALSFVPTPAPLAFPPARP